MTACEGVGGWLAYPRTVDEMEILRTIWSTSDIKNESLLEGGGYTWIGVRRNGTDPAWRNAADGSDITSVLNHLWGPGEPEDSGGGSFTDCVHFRKGERWFAGRLDLWRSTTPLHMRSRAELRVT